MLQVILLYLTYLLSFKILIIARRFSIFLLDNSLTFILLKNEIYFYKCETTFNTNLIIIVITLLF